MLENFANIINIPGLLALIGIGILIWLLLDITKIRIDITGTNDKIDSVDDGIKIKMDSMRKQLREDHDELCAKVDRTWRHLDTPKERRVNRYPNRDNDLE